MSDPYTKSVLTVIAVALIALAIQNAIKSAAAQPGSCGTEIGNPCWIIGSAPLDVFIKR